MAEIKIGAFTGDDSNFFKSNRTLENGSLINAEKLAQDLLKSKKVYVKPHRAGAHQVKGFYRTDTRGKKADGEATPGTAESKVDSSFSKQYGDMKTKLGEVTGEIKDLMSSINSGMEILNNHPISDVDKPGYKKLNDQISKEHKELLEKRKLSERIKKDMQAIEYKAAEESAKKLKDEESTKKGDMGKKINAMSSEEFKKYYQAEGAQELHDWGMNAEAANRFYTNKVVQEDAAKKNEPKGEEEHVNKREQRRRMEADFQKEIGRPSKSLGELFEFKNKTGRYAKKEEPKAGEPKKEGSRKMDRIKFRKLLSKYRNMGAEGTQTLVSDMTAKESPLRDMAKKIFGDWHTTNALLQYTMKKMSKGVQPSVKTEGGTADEIAMKKELGDLQLDLNEAKRSGDKGAAGDIQDRIDSLTKKKEEPKKSSPLPGGSKLPGEKGYSEEKGTAEKPKDVFPSSKETDRVLQNHFSRKPVDDNDIGKTLKMSEASDDLKKFVGSLKTYEAKDVLGDNWVKDLKKPTENYFIVNKDGKKYLVDTEGYSYPRYVTKLDTSEKKEESKEKMKSSHKKFWEKMKRGAYMKKKKEKMGNTPPPSSNPGTGGSGPSVTPVTGVRG